MFYKKTLLKSFLLLVKLLIISNLSSYAQEFPIEKQKRDFQIWSYTNAVYNFGGGSYAFFRFHNQSLAKGESFLNYKEYRLGYAQNLEYNFHLGGFVQNDSENTFTYRFFLRHRSKISKLYFDKQIAFENLNFAKAQFDDLKQARLWLSLTYPLKLRNDKQIYPLLSYEIFKTLDKADPNQNARKIDRTGLRFDLFYEFSPKVKLSLFALKETSYYFALAQFQLDNNGQMVEIKPERKLNIIKPVYGFYLLFNLGNSDKKIE